jgi:hypothetical protein
VSTDRDDVARLLDDDPDRSYRSISRELGISDWLVRKIARELGGDQRPMRQRRPPLDEVSSEDTSPVTGWLVFGGVAIGVAFLIWIGSRGIPPPEL